MNTRTESREQAVKAISNFILKEGLSKTSLRTIGKAIGVSDRMLMYYFRDKADILATVLQHLASRIMQSLETAMPMGQRFPADAMFTRIVEMTDTDEFRPVMALGLEIAAYAQSGQEPYPDIAKTLTTGFINWMDDRLQISSLDERRAQATMLLAMIDGLFKISQSLDQETYEKVKITMIGSLR